MKGKVIAVWFSCGAASAVAAKKTIEKYGKDNTIRVINSPVLEEDSDNRRFLADIEKWLGVEIEIAINPKFPSCSIVDVFNHTPYMSGPKGAACTFQLKKQSRKIWEDKNHHDYLVLGFTAEEKKRHDTFALTERSNVLPVLIEEGITKFDCFRIIREAGIELPRIYAMGYPNANCIGCVKVTSPAYWSLVREKHPEYFAERAKQSRAIKCKLVQLGGKRIFLDELPDVQYRPFNKPLNKIYVDCGIFCEEKIKNDRAGKSKKGNKEASSPAGEDRAV